MSLREEFLKLASAKNIKRIEVAGLGEPLYITGMVSNVSDAFEALAGKEKKTRQDISDARWLVIRNCLVDSDGVQILSAADRKEFDQWQRSFREPIFNEILAISGVTEKEKADLELDGDQGDEKN
jgi:hypothetical protein